MNAAAVKLETQHFLSRIEIQFVFLRDQPLYDCFPTAGELQFSPFIYNLLFIYVYTSSKSQIEYLSMVRIQESCILAALYRNPSQPPFFLTPSC